jgi:YggT family protein
VAVDLVDDVTEPVLRPLRGIIPPVRMGAVGLDVSLLLLFVILFVIRSALGC